ncbi:MAG: serine/threonine-protein kinase [Anaerolineales bacterium]|nr:serine/threonine-protein kinase [Anaerolineales bacterium]
MSNLIGQFLGRYHILEQLGEGGMATVYKAYDTRLERHVAVKVILPYRQHSEKFLKRFEREAKSLAQLSHPNIVGVIDYGEEDGVPYLVMEYLPGGTLKQKLGKPIDAGEAARLLAPIAYALELAHRHNIIHRDINPANVLLTETGQPMLSDFGIAKMLESEETAELTGTGVGIGTPEYMAPEQGMGHVVDGRADIYALGITYYELVTGRKPYRADTPMAILHKQLSEPLPRPSKFVAGIPEYVENVLIKALAKDPANRYQNMGEFAQALDSIAGQKLAVPKIAVSKRKIVPALAGLFVVALVGVGIYLASTSNLFASQTESITPTKPQQPGMLERPTYPPGTGLGDGLVVQPCGQGLCILNSSGTSIREFKIAELAGKTTGSAFWSNDGTKIAFDIADSGPGNWSDLYVLEVQTGKATQLTRTPDNEITPVWSPDGKKIAFHKNCELWMINPDSSGLEKHFERGDQCVSQPRWSPDSQWLAWVSPNGRDGGGAQFVSVYNPNEKKIFSIPLEFDKDSGHNDEWSPDGSALYVTIETQGRRDVYKLDTACLQTDCSEANVTMVDFDIPQSWMPNYYPQWDKNSQMFKFTTPLESLKNSTVYVCDAKSLCLRGDNGIEIARVNLPQLSGEIYEATWKLDGTALLFSASDGRARPDTDGDLFAADLITRNLIRLTQTETNDHFPVFSPDGKKVAFHSNCQGKILDLENNQTQTFLENPEQCVGELRWSPSGRWLAWVSGQHWDGSPSNDIGIYDTHTSNVFITPIQENFHSDHRLTWTPDESALNLEIQSPGNNTYQIPPECFERNCAQSEWTIAPAPGDSIQWLPDYYPQWSVTP